MQPVDTATQCQIDELAQRVSAPGGGDQAQETELRMGRQDRRREERHAEAPSIDDIAHVPDPL